MMASEGAAAISEALVIWIGWGYHFYPKHDEARLVEQVGSLRAAELMPTLRALWEEFFDSHARDKVADLAEMADAAAARFRGLHAPGLLDCWSSSLGCRGSQ